MKGKQKKQMYQKTALGMAAVLMLGMFDITSFASVSSGNALPTDVSETVSSGNAPLSGETETVSSGNHTETNIWHFDFGTETSQVQDGFTKIAISDSYSYPGNAGYGWITAPNQTYQYKNTNLTGDLAGMEALACDRVRGTDGAYEFAVDVPNGKYEIIVYTGHPEAKTYQFPCTIENTEMELQTVSDFTAVPYDAVISDGTLNLVVDERSPAAARVMQGLAIKLIEASKPDSPKLPPVAEVIEGQEPTVYYSQSFDDASTLQNGLPAGWSTAGTIDSSSQSGDRSIKTDGGRSYYSLDTMGSDPKYSGKVLTGLSKSGWITYDFHFTETSSEKYGLGLSSYPNSVNSGNIAIRGTVFPNGDVWFYNGSSNTKIANIKDAGWVHFVYEFHNGSKLFTVKITDVLTGKLIGQTNEAFHYNHEKGQVGAFSFSANGPSQFGVDEIKVYGYPTPFTFVPEIEPLKQEGKVILEENENEFILKNDDCKIIIDKKKAVIKKFYTKEGNEILGNSGDGSYLINYTDSGHIGTSKQEMTLKNCTGRIVRQSDSLCEVSVKEVRLSKGDKEGNILPIDLDFRFVMKKDSPGLYMYAILNANYTEEDIAAGRKFNFGQSRYSVKFDYERLPYSAVSGGEIGGQLIKMPGPGDFNMDIKESVNNNGQLFDSTYVLNDGNIFTKYNNLSYQYCNNMVGAFNNQGGLTLITPSRDWAGGGYAKQDIDVHGGTGNTFLVSWHLETGHNGTKGVDVEDGYQKVYGPVMWYASTDEKIHSKEDAYADACAQAAIEETQWPYSWMAPDTYTNPNDCAKEYAATTRGSLKGTFSVKNGTINTQITNDLTVTDANGQNSIGWAVLSDERSEYWALDNDFYEFYAPVQKDGTFEIDNIIPGTYKLNINVNGVMDEYVQRNIVIGENEAKNLGNIVWDDPIYGETLWTIGVADKTAEEYAYAYPCRYWGSHLLFNDLFPNGVDFKIGESREATDWFFVQMASQTAGHKEHYNGAFYFDNATKKVKYDAARATEMTENDSRFRGNELASYKIRFDNDKDYSEGTATLLINVCGNRFGSIRATLNGENVIDTANRVTVNGGSMTDAKGNTVTNPEDTTVISLYTDGSVGRSGLIGVNQLVKIEFDASLIQKGENVLTLTHDHPAYREDNTTPWENSDYTIYAGNIYDAIRLDVDGKTAPEPEKPAPENPETPDSEEPEVPESEDPQEPKHESASETTVSPEQSILESLTAFGQSSVVNVTAGRNLIISTEITRALKEQDQTLALHIGNGFTFSLSGREVTPAAMRTAIDLSNRLEQPVTSNDVLQPLLKETVCSKQISIQSGTLFGMNVNLHANLGTENAGKYACFYRKDTQTSKYRFIGMFQITQNGQAMFGITAGGDYLLTVTENNPDISTSLSDYYIVKNRDTLSSIARRYKMPLTRLAAYNPHILDINRIYPGQKIYIR